ncbi:MAG: arsenic resistance protein [Chloroflexaceae bacterium]|nr:arsenic resistance protein [Chloroflexaceae bacterium]
MWKAMQWLQKNLIWSIPASMILGILIGSLTHPSFLRMTIIPLTFLMVYPMMVNLDIKRVFSPGDTKLQIVTQVMNFGIVPFLGFGMGSLFFADKPLLIVGLLLTSLLPTSGMTISWTGFARGNIPAAVKMTVIGLVIGSLATPFYLQFLAGTIIEIPLGEVFQQILFIVFLPMAAGYATQRFIIWKAGKETYQKVWKPRFPALSTLGVLGIVFVAMALKADTIVQNPVILIQLLLPLLLLYGINFALSTIVGKFFFNRGDGIALVYGTVMRNLSIALAIAMTVFGPQGSEIALIIAVAYIIQVQAAAWYVKFTDAIFGAAPAEVATPAPVAPSTSQGM